MVPLYLFFNSLFLFHGYRVLPYLWAQYFMRAPGCFSLLPLSSFFLLVLVLVSFMLETFPVVWCPFAAWLLLESISKLPIGSSVCTGTTTFLQWGSVSLERHCCLGNVAWVLVMDGVRSRCIHILAALPVERLTLPSSCNLVLPGRISQAQSFRRLNPLFPYTFFF